MSLSMAMIALSDADARPDAAAIVADLATRWPDLPTASEPTTNEAGTFSFTVGDLIAAGGVMPFPIPWSDLDGPCAASALWPEAADTLRPHAAHVILTVTGSDDPLARARLLTQVTAALLSTCPAAIGVFWTEAGLVLPPPLFVEDATRILPDKFPVFLWIDFRVGKSAAHADRTAGFTTGMNRLGHMDIETEDAADSPVQLRGRLADMCQYLLQRGPVIADGHTIGQSAEEKIKVVYSDSLFGQEGRVMRLVWGTAKKANRWQRGF